MRIPKNNTANVETEERYIKIVTLYLNIEEEENKRKYFNSNRKRAGQ